MAENRILGSSDIDGTYRDKYDLVSLVSSQVGGYRRGDGKDKAVVRKPSRASHKG